MRSSGGYRGRRHCRRRAHAAPKGGMALRNDNLSGVCGAAALADNFKLRAGLGHVRSVRTKMSLPGPGFIQGCERTHGWLAAVAVAVATSRSWPRAGLVGGSPVCSSSRSSTGRHTPVSSQPLACSTVRVRCRATSPLGSPGDKRRALTSSPPTGANRRTHWQEPWDGPGDCSLSCSTPDSSGQRVDLSSIQSGKAPVCLLPLRSGSTVTRGCSG